jgi:Protein of unknown function (DUF4239)
VLRSILDAVPLTLLLIAAVGFSVVVVLLAVWLIRRIVPATSEGFHAEISAPMVGVVAALFGLLLAFVIVIAYQNFLDADDNVSREADSLSSIVRDSAAFPDPGGENVRLAVGTYVRAVVNEEWPQMHDGNDSALARTGLEGIFAAFRTVEPRSRQATAFYDDAVRQLNAALAARRDRLQTAGGGLPRDIALLILFNGRLRRARRISTLRVSRARASRHSCGGSGLPCGAPRPQLPLLGRRLDRTGRLQDRSARTILPPAVAETAGPSFHAGPRSCGHPSLRSRGRRPGRCGSTSAGRNPSSEGRGLLLVDETSGLRPLDRGGARYRVGRI